MSTVTAAAPTETMFVRFVESNDHEGETWSWWLQVTGNAKEITKLAGLLDTGDEPWFVLHLTEIEPESAVDLLVRYADQGYYASHNKVVGTLACPDVLGDADDKLALLYKGGIRDLFTPA